MGPRKRTAVLLNIIMFCGLSFVFNLVVFSLGKGQSVLSMVNENLIYEYNWQLFLVLASIVSIYRVKKFSIFIYLALTLSVFFSTLSIFLEGFDKVILALTFIFAVVAYYYLLLLKAELDEPYYNPNYSEGQLFSYAHKDLEVRLSNKSHVISGTLTNWGESGFFCKVDGERPKGKVDFTLNFKGKEFTGNGVVVYHSKTGIGIKSINKKMSALGWPEFYGIMDEFGIRPKLSTS